MNLVEQLKQLEAATKDAQAMTGAAIVAAIHTLAAGLNAVIEIQAIQSLTSEAKAEATKEAA